MQYIDASHRRRAAAQIMAFCCCSQELYQQQMQLQTLGVLDAQVAVNKLAKSGEALAAGDLPAVAATVG